MARLLPTNRALVAFIPFGILFGRLVSDLMLALMNLLTTFPNTRPNSPENSLPNSSVACDAGELLVSEVHANSTYNSI